MSKGSKQRPLSVSRELFDENWNAIFKTNSPPSKDEIADMLAARCAGLLERGVDKFGMARWLSDGALWKLHLTLLEGVSQEIIEVGSNKTDIKNILLKYV